MKSVGDLASAHPPVASPLWSARQAAEVLERCGCGCLVVVQEGQVVGLVSARQLVGAHPNRLLADVMLRQPPCAESGTPLWEALARLGPGEEYLVVAQRGRLQGVVSREAIQQELACLVCPLTGLPRAEMLKGRAEQWLLQGHEVAVIFLDMDDFRWVNKHHGHVVGDHVLLQVSRLLSRHVAQDRDVLGRYGGDEFAVVTLRPLTEAEMLASALVEAVQKARIEPAGVQLTVSAGVAGGRRHCARPGVQAGWTVDDLFNLASLASTRAKKTARAVSVVTGHGLAQVPQGLPLEV